MLTADGLRQNEPVVVLTFLVSALVERSTVSLVERVLVTLIFADVLWPGFCDTLIWVGLSRLPPTFGPVVPGNEAASFTAASTLRRPAPCCSAGALMSEAELTRICFTCAGDGSTPWWVLA